MIPLSKEKASFLTRVQWRIKSWLWQLKCSTSSDELFQFTLKDKSCFYYPLRTLIGRALFMEVFEKQEIQIVERFLKEGDIFVDIGANGGFYTVIAAKIVGSSGHVYAIEPGIRELNLLRQNISVNNLTNVTIIEKAVSNKKGNARFAISKDGAMNSLLENSHPDQKIEEWQDVELTTVDDIVRDFKIEKVDFIKIDVEGAEKFVHSDSHNPIVLFEASDLTSESFGYLTKDLLSTLLDEKNFLYYIGAGNKLMPISEYHSRFGQDIYNFIGSKFELNR
jgi:FkbM family methyltransferase